MYVEQMIKVKVSPSHWEEGLTNDITVFARDGSVEKVSNSNPYNIAFAYFENTGRQYQSETWTVREIAFSKFVYLVGMYVGAVQRGKTTCLPHFIFEWFLSNSKEVTNG